jgi:hypothetical protein
MKTLFKSISLFRILLAVASFLFGSLIVQIVLCLASCSADTAPFDDTDASTDMDTDSDTDTDADADTDADPDGGTDADTDQEIDLNTVCGHTPIAFCMSCFSQSVTDVKAQVVDPLCELAGYGPAWSWDTIWIEDDDLIEITCFYNVEAVNDSCTDLLYVEELDDYHGANLCVTDIVCSGSGA